MQENSVVQQLMEEFKTNPILWGKYYCPNHFCFPFAGFHLQIMIEALRNKYIAIAAPRGSAKSTLLSFLRPLHALCFNLEQFIVIVSNTYNKSAMSLENIKKELRENNKLKTFHNVVIRKDAEGDSIFKHPNGQEMRILCKGADQIGSIRGEKFGAFRPTLILVDDLEDDEMVKNPERRKYLQDLYDEALIPALDFRLGKVCVVGTVLHDDSQIAKLISKSSYKEYCKLMFKALIVEGTEKKSLWNEKWTIKDLEWLAKYKPDVFAKEMQNDPVAGSQQVFHKEDFRYWTIEDNQYLLYSEDGRVASRGPLTTCRAAISCDLAWEDKRESDYSVILGALLTPQSDIIIENIIYKKGMRPDELSEQLYIMRDRLYGMTKSYIPIGFEKAKLEKVAKWFITRIGRENNDPLFFKDLQWDTDKISRIMTKLQPRYSQHMIYHRKNMGELEYQLTRFPSASHDDLPDALQGVCQLLQFPKTISKKTENEDDLVFNRLRALANKNKPYSRRYAMSKFPFAQGKLRHDSIKANISPFE